MLDRILQELKEIKLLLGSQKKIWTLDEFCAYTGISKLYAYHLTSTNKIKCSRPFGKKIFFNSDEVIEFLKQNAVDGEKEIKGKINRYLLNKVV
jgi:prophage regulatory protein